MADTYKYGSIYKVKTGTNTWEHHFFKTRADLVDPAQYTASNTTYYKLPLDTQYHTVNGQHFGQTSGITLGGSNIYVGGSTDSDSANYNQYYDLTLEEAIRALKAGVDAAQTLDADLTAIAGLTGTSGYLKKTAANTWSLDTTVLTSSNYSSTLGSVYEAKFTDGSATIAEVLTGNDADKVKIYTGVTQSDGAIGAGSSSITLAKVAKTGAFGDLSGTDWLVQTDDTLTSGRIVVGNGNKNVQSSSYSVSDIVNIANGASKAYSTHLLGYRGDGAKYLIQSDTPITTSVDVSNYDASAPSGIIVSEVNPYTNDVAIIKRYIWCVYYNSDANKYMANHSIDTQALKTGDVLYIVEENAPDFWYVAGNAYPEIGFAKLIKLESTKQNLSGYSTTSHTHTTSLASDSGTSSITLAYGSKYKLTAGGTSVVFTMPSSDNTNYYHTRQYTSGLKISTGTGVDDLYVPAPSTTHGGIVPALVSASVSTQTTSTKFLREDGTWAVPSYTTDTDKKAASGDSDSKIFLIGATSQSTDGQTTYSHGEVYVGTDHCLYSNSVRVRNIYVASSAPSSAVIGDIWIDTTSAA